MRTLLFCLLALVLAACDGNTTVLHSPLKPIDKPIATTSTQSHSETSSSLLQASSSAKQAASSLAASVRIAMPFSTQAPLKNWDMPFQEACEEASLILVERYLRGTALSDTEMQEAILDMVAYEESQGLPPDITIRQLADVAESYYGLHAQVLRGDDVSAQRIKEAIGAGTPVIVPLAGQRIGNPYYSGEGPPYHMLVINGYDDTGFLTHDVGTKRGAYYRYSQSVLLDAIHDWTGNVETIEQGEKAMLLLSRP